MGVMDVVKSPACVGQEAYRYCKSVSVEASRYFSTSLAQI
jgi:hypothetical protein